MKIFSAITINITLFFLIGGPLWASTNWCNLRWQIYKEKTFCSESFIENYKTLERKEAKPFIKLITPNGGEIWIEGKTYEIKWKSRGVDKVYISVAMGGKDKGHLGEGGKIDAKRGRFSWTIPVGFVTGFGILKAENMRIVIHDAQNRDIFDVSDNYFTIKGTSALSDLVIYEGQDEYREAIIQYYKAIANKQYRKAYEMLGQCKIVLYDADGSGVAFLPRRDYNSWVKAQENIDTLTIIDVRRLEARGDANKGDAEETLGIRTYMVRLIVKLHEERRIMRSGQHTFFVAVVKGIDNKIRILGIGTGP
ncbi:MAG: hypothetical protein JRI46_07255 [Deltaproteobacteria bacterium]|nr:hypothetical protein [Deltaproteobacteria bacterium]